MIPQRAADQQHIARRNLAHAPVYACGNRTDTGGVNKHFIRRPTGDDFGIAGHDGNTRRRGCRGHAGDDAFQRCHLQPLLQNKAAGEPARNCAADGHVISRTADSQLANIAAGEKQRVDNVAVRGKGQPIALGGQFLKGNAGLIFLLIQKRVGEGAHKKLTDQLLHGLSTAPVGEGYLFQLSHS